MTLSDVTEASRKPSKRRRYNSIYLSERERKGKGKKENAREREGFVTSSARWLCAAMVPGDAAEVKSIEIF